MARMVLIRLGVGLYCALLSVLVFAEPVDECTCTRERAQKTLDTLGNRDVPNAKARFQEAQKLALSCAQQGHAPFQIAMGLIFEDIDKENSLYNLEQSRDWYRRAAEQGHPAAEYMYGAALEYYKSSGAHSREEYDKIYAEAVDWYLKAAEHGHPPRSIIHR